MEPIHKSTILNQIAANDYLPSLSLLTIQLIELAADEHSSILDLTRIIEKDPGLTARLLKIVNSAFYAHREPISSISYAVMVAGFNKIRVMALNISLKDTFPLGKVKGMDYDFFWKTSLYRAIIAQGMVKGSYLIDRVDFEEVFTAGLILEIGLLLLFHLCPEPLKESFPGGDVPLEEAIRWAEENIGISHRELGRLTLERWHFPEQFLEVQKTYGPEALQEGTSDLCKISEIARICTHLFFGFRDDFALLKEISGLLKMDLDRISEILSEAFFRVEEFARELRLQINPNQDMLEVMEKANRALIKINGSLEENLGKFVGMISSQDQETRPHPSDLPEEQKKNLETAMDAVAHEIRNPLMVIGGFAQRLVTKGHEQVDVVKYAELIAQESRRLEQVLNDVMDYSTPYKPSFHPQDLVLVLEETVKGLSGLLAQQQVTIQKNFLPFPLPIPLDREGFGKSLRLLLETFIGLAEKNDKKIILNMEIFPAPPRVKIEIKFLGEPISEEINQVLLGYDFFNRTFGKGLGLSLCRKIIQAHNGRIEIQRENEENRGLIILPLSTGR